MPYMRELIVCLINVKKFREKEVIRIKSKKIILNGIKKIKVYLRSSTSPNNFIMVSQI
mgnify:CR=1 FL=1